MVAAAPPGKTQDRPTPAPCRPVVLSATDPRRTASVQRSDALGGALRRAVLQRADADGRLTSCILSHSQRLQQAANNNPTLRQGTHSEDVASVQFGLRQIGMPLEQSFPDGVPDGKYGPDTAANVRQFQIDEKISPPGGFEVGRRTLVHLDNRILDDNVDVCEPKPKPKPPEPPPPSPPIANITCGGARNTVAAKAIKDAIDLLDAALMRFSRERAAAADAAFIMFRSRDFATMADADRHMQGARVAIPRQEYRCFGEDETTCDSATAAFSLNFNPVVGLCPLFFVESTNRPRVIVHEGMHMAGLQRPGVIFDPEHSLRSEDPFVELEPTLSTAERIRNADHNAGFVLALAKKTTKELADAAAHRAGGDLRIGLRGRQTMPATGFIPSIVITGNEDAQVGITRDQTWRVTDDRNVPVAVRPLTDINEARLPRQERDRVVASGATALLVSVEIDVVGAGRRTLSGRIAIDR